MPTYDAQGFRPPAPVAMVTLRTQDGRKSLSDVEMLIDSGADVSLIPESSVRHVGTGRSGARRLRVDGL